MAVSTAQERHGEHAADVGGAPAPQPTRGYPTVWRLGGLAALVGVAAALNVWRLTEWLWIDEGISVGISSHQLTRIPGLLRVDGNPPLYYLLLHGWIRLFGASEVSVHSLSLLFGLALVPLAFWAGRSLFGERAGWFAAVIAAFDPFIGSYMTETRMYTLVMLLGLLATAFFLHAFVFERRRFVIPFALALAALLYTHTWALYFAGAAGLAWIVLVVTAARADRQGLLKRGAGAFALAGALYVPWLPTLLYQAAHTAAPWSSRPKIREALTVVDAITGDTHERVLVALVLTAGVALFEVARRGTTAYRRAVLAAPLLAGATLGAGWLAAQITPAWSVRYVAIVLPPLVLTAAFGLARAARLGFVALGLIVLIWIQPLARIDGALKPLRADVKSTEKGLAARVAPYLVPSDVVVVTQLEEGPVLHYYLHVPVHLATPAGPVSDPGVADWRDATDRLTAATPAVDLLPLVAGLHIGQHVVVVCPRQASTAHELPWFRLMDTHCRDWNATLASDSRFQPAPIAGLDAVQPGMSRYVTLYNKVSM